MENASRRAGRTFGRFFYGFLAFIGAGVLIFGIFGAIFGDQAGQSQQEQQLAAQGAPGYKGVTPTVPSTYVPPSPAPQWEPIAPKLPDFDAGQIISGAEFIDQFIALNRGVNDFDDRQLTYLGNECWASYLAMSNSGNSGFFSDIFGGGGIDEAAKFQHDWNEIARQLHERNSEEGAPQ